MVSYSASFISPEVFWPVAFFGLAYPFLLLGNILFLAYWIFRRRIQVLLPIISLALGIPFHYDLFNYFSANDSSDWNKDRVVKVMSFNVRLFDLYNWSNNKKTRNEILSFLQYENPDVICFQEYFYQSGKKKFETRDTLVKILKANKYYEYFTDQVKDQHFGISIYSKYEIMDSGVLDFGKSGWNNTAIYIDIVKNSDTIRVYNMHLASIHFSKLDYKFIEDPAQEENEVKIQKSKRIMTRVRNAFIRRAEQAEIVSEHVRNSKYKTIVCGDFNDNHMSYAYNTILDSKDLTDAFTQSGKGFGISYNGNFPAFRIDYIFHDDSFLSDDFRTVREPFSDHFPVVCNLYLKEEE